MDQQEARSKKQSYDITSTGRPVRSVLAKGNLANNALLVMHKITSKKILKVLMVVVTTGST